MRPSYTKTHKKCIRKRNSLLNKTALFGCSRRNTFDLEHINQVLSVHKSKLAQRSWKVMPKDSREVYKIRRKREIEKKNRNYERDDSVSNQNDTTRGGSSNKQRDNSSKSSYSSDSASETSCSLTDSDN